MITWQDPVALTLAALLFAAALGWRRALIKRGEGPACARCEGHPSDARDTPDAPDAHAGATRPRAAPVRIDVARLRMSRPRR